MDTDELARRAEEARNRTNREVKEAEEIYDAEVAAIKEKTEQLKKEKQDRLSAARSGDLGVIQDVLARRAEKESGASVMAPKPSPKPSKKENGFMDKIEEA